MRSGSFYNMLFKALATVALLVLGCWWCKEVAGRFRSDVDALRFGDGAERFSVILIWIITLGVFAGVVLYVIGAVLSIRQLL